MNRDRQNGSFRVHWLCWFLLMTAVAVFAAGFVLVGDWRAERVGALVGTLVAVGAIPLLVAWIVYRIANGSDRAPSVAFFTTVVVCVAAQMALLRDDLERSGGSGDRVYSLEDVLDRAEARGSDQDRAGMARKRMDELETESPELAAALRRIANRRERVGRRHDEAVARVDQQRFLDFAAMLDAADYAWQLETAEGYRAASSESLGAVEAMSETVEQELAVTGLEPAERREVQAGFMDSFEKRRPALRGIYQAHVSMAEQFLALLRFLQRHHGQWTLDGDGLPRVSSPEAQLELEGLVQSLSRADDALSEQLSRYNAAFGGRR